MTKLRKGLRSRATRRRRCGPQARQCQGLGAAGLGRRGWRGDRAVRTVWGEDRTRAGPVAAAGTARGVGVVADQQALSFAGLLRQLRAEARLTQEELAEAAGLSPRSVSDLERGIHATAHKDNAGLLVGVLGLAGPARELFIAAARGKAPASEVLAARQAEAARAFAAAATRALPRDIASFTGRQAELTRLMGALDDLSASGGVVGIHAIGGMAGSARPPLWYTPRTGWSKGSPMGSSSCRCTPTPPGSGQLTRPTRWPACC
jgi:transcriptional regulator with XRE-family HTH domain